MLKMLVWKVCLSCFGVMLVRFFCGCCLVVLLIRMLSLLSFFIICVIVF